MVRCKKRVEWRQIDKHHLSIHEYLCHMIKTIRHAGLKRFYEKGETRGLKQDQVSRIRRILFLLDQSSELEDIRLVPGMRLHPLKGDLSGDCSLSVSGNWRIVFQFADGEASNLDLVDYH